MYAQSEQLRTSELEQVAEDKLTDQWTPHLVAYAGGYGGMLGD